MKLRIITSAADVMWPLLRQATRSVVHLHAHLPQPVAHQPVVHLLGDLVARQLVGRGEVGCEAA